MLSTKLADDSDDDFAAPRARAPAKRRRTGGALDRAVLGGGEAALGEEKAEEQQAAAPPEPAAEPAPAHEEHKERNVFSTLRLRRILRENHGGDVARSVFWRSPGGAVQANGNLVAFVGGAQANVFDNEHCGSHLDIVSHFTIGGAGYKALADGTVAKAEGTITCCCWLYGESNDALLALGDDSGQIRILSLARSKEIKIFAGHDKEIVDIKSHPHLSHLLMTVSKDHKLRIWDHTSGDVKYEVSDIAVSSAVFDKSGDSVWVGTTSGDLYKFAYKYNITVNKSKATFVNKGFMGDLIDCMYTLTSEMIVARSINGKIVVWDPIDDTTERTFSPKGGFDHYCQFDVSADEKYMCVGGKNGDISVYDLASGKLLREMRHKRCTKAIYTSIICGGADSLIFRFDVDTPGAEQPTAQ